MKKKADITTETITRAIRMPKYLGILLDKASAKNDRSFNKEMVNRLRNSFEIEGET